MNSRDLTRQRLLAHCRAYPQAGIRDVFKYLYQSAFGCEHLVASPEAAIERIRQERDGALMSVDPAVEPLDGAYSRVHLALLGKGLDAATLGRLFCLSAKQEQDGHAALEQKLDVAAELIRRGELPFSSDEFAAARKAWAAEGYGALHHSEAFRQAYHPAYRVIANEYLPYLPLLAAIDLRMAEGPVRLAIEGGSAGGKTTLAALLSHIYGCTVFHMDDFFLRPEQRTPERYTEPGGNVDRERFLDEVLLPLSRGENVTYRRFDCATMTLQPPVCIRPTPLTVIEGAYSMHPDLAPHYDLSVFLDINQELQRARILRRNGPAMAKRFFEQWIPLEVRYFHELHVRERCDLILAVNQQ